MGLAAGGVPLVSSWEEGCPVPAVGLFGLQKLTAVFSEFSVKPGLRRSIDIFVVLPFKLMTKNFSYRFTTACGPV